MSKSFLARWREAIETLPTTRRGFIDAEEELEHQFRTLRLWHWNMMRYHRNCANTAQRHSTGETLNTAQADFHLKQVQLLNVFFPIGDTAEADASK